MTLKNKNSEDGRMISKTADESCLELYDVATKEKVAEAPLAKIKFVPRAGERIFIALQGGDWKSFDVISVEYFLGYDRSTGEPSRSVSAGVGRITLYVEPSKAAHARVDSP
jgi:hypothetical protein